MLSLRQCWVMHAKQGKGVWRMNYAQIGFVAVTKLPGVSDITPVMAKGLFAKALIAEAEGKHTEAAELLERAIKALEVSNDK